jgi:hypothetical protein
MMKAAALIALCLLASPAFAKAKHVRHVAPHHAHLTKHVHAVNAVVHVPTAALIKRKPARHKRR